PASPSGPAQTGGVDLGYRSSPRTRSAKIAPFFPGGDVPEGWSMSVQVQCPNPDCRAEFAVSDAELGRPVHCEECGREFSPLTTLGPGAPAAGETQPMWAPPRPPEL